jgi:DNA polymerase
MKQKKLQPLPPGTVVSGKYIQGFGPSNAKIMLVSDFPDDDEDKLGEGFVGQRGKLIDGILKEAGIDGGIKACYKTFAIKFHPPMGNLKLLHVYGRSVDEHKEQLVEEIRAINPVVIIPMGEIALNTVANLTKIQEGC